MNRVLVLGAAAALLVAAWPGEADADLVLSRKRRPPMARKAAASGKMTVKLRRFSAGRHLRISSAMLARLRSISQPRRNRRPIKVGALVGVDAWRYAGIGAGALMMGLALLLALRRRPSLRRALPPVLVAVALLVGGALYTAQVNADRAAPKRAKPRIRAARYSTSVAVKTWNRGHVRVELPLDMTRTACRRAGWRR